MTDDIIMEKKVCIVCKHTMRNIKNDFKGRVMCKSCWKSPTRRMQFEYLNSFK